MPDRVRASPATIARLLTELGIEMDAKAVNNAAAVKAVLDKLRAPEVTVVPAIAPLGHPLMSAMLPALGAHYAFSDAYPEEEWLLPWFKATIREERDGFQPSGDGTIWLELTVSNGRITRRPLSGRTRFPSRSATNSKSKRHAGQRAQRRTPA